MKKELFVIESYIKYEGSQLVGVFNNFKSAVKMIKEHLLVSKHFDHVDGFQLSRVIQGRVYVEIQLLSFWDFPRKEA
jgi:hypothetical protein